MTAHRGPAKRLEVSRLLTVAALACVIVGCGQATTFEYVSEDRTPSHSVGGWELRLRLGSAPALLENDSLTYVIYVDARPRSKPPAYRLTVDSVRVLRADGRALPVGGHCVSFPKVGHLEKFPTSSLTFPTIPASAESVECRLYVTLTSEPAGSAEAASLDYSLVFRKGQEFQFGY